MGLPVENLIRLIPFLKWRLYRFDNNLLNHIAAELIETYWRQQRPLQPKTMAHVTQALEIQLSTGEIVFDANYIAEQEGVDLRSVLERRLDGVRIRQQDTFRRPRRIVSIVGAPRSGTSFLYNLLTYFTNWAVFTDCSHHLWSFETLADAEKWFLRKHPESVLNQNTRDIKLAPIYSLPSEAENILHRSIPAYAHLGGHTYDMQEAIVVDKLLLLYNVSEHLRFFGSDTILLKSPFNSFRMPQLTECFPETKWDIIHIFRDGHLSAASMRENHFAYQWEKTLHDPESAWCRFVRACLENSHGTTTPLNYERLRDHPTTTLLSLAERLQVDFNKIPALEANRHFSRPLPEKRNPQIEVLNAQLEALNPV